jgi:hypothetical protein
MICAELREWEEAEKVFNKLIAESNKAFGPDSKPLARSRIWEMCMCS